MEELVLKGENNAKTPAMIGSQANSSPKGTTTKNEDLNKDVGENLQFELGIGTFNFDLAHEMEFHSFQFLFILKI